MTPATAPADTLPRFVKIATRRGNYPGGLARLLLTAVTRVVKSMRQPTASVADVERWLDGPGAAPAAFMSKFPISDATHATYVSRARKVLADYYRCGGDVAAWALPDGAALPRAPRAESNAIELPLSSGRAAQLTFPGDLSSAEARAIVAQLDGLKAIFLARAALENNG